MVRLRSPLTLSPFDFAQDSVLSLIEGLSVVEGLFLQGDPYSSRPGAIHPKKPLIFLGKNLYFDLGAGNPQLLQGNLNCFLGSAAFYFNALHPALPFFVWPMNISLATV